MRTFIMQTCINSAAPWFYDHLASSEVPLHLTAKTNQPKHHGTTSELLNQGSPPPPQRRPFEADLPSVRLYNCWAWDDARASDFEDALVPV